MFYPEYLSAFCNKCALQTPYGNMLDELYNFDYAHDFYVVAWKGFRKKTLIKKYLEELVKISGNID